MATHFENKNNAILYKGLQLHENIKPQNLNLLILAIYLQ